MHFEHKMEQDDAFVNEQASGHGSVDEEEILDMSPEYIYKPQGTLALIPVDS